MKNQNEETSNGDLSIATLASIFMHGMHKISAGECYSVKVTIPENRVGTAPKAQSGDAKSMTCRSEQHPRINLRVVPICIQVIWTKSPRNDTTIIV